MPEVTIRGLDRASKALLQVPESLQDKVQAEVLRSAFNVQRNAKELAPVDTGRLRNSISIEILDGGNSARVGTNVEYAPFVEFGTSRMSAQPFLFPAYEMEWRRLVERLKGGAALSVVVNR